MPGGQGVVREEAVCVQWGWSNNNIMKTYSQISKQVNILVDACFNIVKSKNISVKICQEMNKSGFSFSISIDVNKKRKKKSPSQKKREEKRRKDWIKKKEDANKQLTTDDSEASDKCESPPIVPGNTDTQMVDDIASDSESTSTTNDSKASDKCESPLIVPGNTDTQIVDAITYAAKAQYQKMFQMSQMLDESIRLCQSSKV